MVAYAAPSPFPPSFEGDPWAYAFGLFGDLVATALCLALLLGYIFEPIRKRQINKILRNPVKQGEAPMWSVAGLYRSFVVALLTFVVMRAGPDALWMLAWGEVTDPTIRFLITLDLWLDALALAPLSFAIMCWAWGRQAIPQALVSHRAMVRVGVPTWGFFAKNARVVLVVLFIAVGVTIGKAGREVGRQPAPVPVYAAP